MREIKFRAWDKKYRKMYEGDIRTALAFPDEDIEIMQYTGLKDMHGKEIYEWDVIKCVVEGSQYTLPVEEDEGCFVVKIKDGREAGYWPCLCLTRGREVIGNVYESPNLLGE